MIFEETVIFKLEICDLQVFFTDFECSKNDVSSAGKKKSETSFKDFILKEHGKVVLGFQILDTGLSNCTKSTLYSCTAPLFVCWGN